MWIKKSEIGGASGHLEPIVRGGAISYKVDLSQMECGCVAGIYAVRASEWCAESE